MGIGAGRARRRASGPLGKRREWWDGAWNKKKGVVYIGNSGDHGTLLRSNMILSILFLHYYATHSFPHLLWKLLDSIRRIALVHKLFPCFFSWSISKTTWQTNSMIFLVPTSWCHFYDWTVRCHASELQLMWSTFIQQAQTNYSHMMVLM